MNWIFNNNNNSGGTYRYMNYCYTFFHLIYPSYILDMQLTLAAYKRLVNVLLTIRTTHTHIHERNVGIKKKVSNTSSNRKKKERRKTNLNNIYVLFKPILFYIKIQRTYICTKVSLLFIYLIIILRIPYTDSYQFK